MTALIVAIRWLHALAATAWVGGMLFYLLALLPALERIGSREQRATLAAAVAQHFRDLTQASVAALLVTGAILTFDRLSQPHLKRAYVIVLGVKVLLSLMMVGLTGLVGRPQGGRRFPRWLSPPSLILLLGLVVYLLSMILQMLFDTSYGAAS